MKRDTFRSDKPDISEWEGCSRYVAWTREFTSYFQRMKTRRNPTATDAVLAYLKKDGQSLAPSTGHWRLSSQVSIRWRSRWVIKKRLRDIRIELVGTLPSVWIPELETLGLRALHPCPDLRFEYNSHEGCLTISGNSDQTGGAPCLFRLRHAPDDYGDPLWASGRLLIGRLD